MGVGELQLIVNDLLSQIEGRLVRLLLIIFYFILHRDELRIQRTVQFLHSKVMRRRLYCEVLRRSRLSVCLHVCVSANIFHKPHEQILLHCGACCLHSHNSVLSWQHAVFYLLPVLWMTSCFHNSTSPIRRHAQFWETDCGASHTFLTY